MHRSLRGVSLIDVIVGSFLVLVVFLVIFGLLRASLAVSTVAKARAAATAIASSQLEYVRSLSYDNVGTIGGIPPGIVPQHATTTLDGFTFATRTFIEYVDDPADGTGASDATGIITDYKRVRIAVSYTINDRVRDVSLVSSIVPPGLETTTGGGTLKVDVVDAAGAPVPGASVRVVNASTSPAVDVTTFANSLGIVYLPGAATSSQYQITVTKDGYSTAQTYARNATNQNPTPGFMTVVKDQTTTGTFAIDRLASLIVRTFLPIQSATTTDTFASSARVTDAINTVVAGDALTLSGTPGAYPATGSARSTAIAPASLVSWGSVTATVSTPALTTAAVQVADGAGVPLPDAVLPGNTSGFTSFPISLSGVSTTTYPSLTLIAKLGSADPFAAPSVLEWSLGYAYGPVPLPNIPFTLRGAKTIGSTGAGAAIYKTTIATSTDSAGVVSLAPEWDIYTFTISGYDVIDACQAPPYTIAPGASYDHSLTLGSSTPHMLLASVRDAGGAPVAGASVTLSRTGYAKTVTSTACGAAYFGNLTSASDYTLQLQKTGYTTTTDTGITVSGKVFYAAPFD